MNTVSLVGRVTRDLELIKTTNDKSLVTFTLAVNRPFKNKLGQSETDFIQCNCWNKLAEHIASYCGKGSLIGITGRLQSRSYVNNEEKRVYLTEVQVGEVKFLQLKTQKQVFSDVKEFEIPEIFN